MLERREHEQYEAYDSSEYHIRMNIEKWKHLHSLVDKPTSQ